MPIEYVPDYDDNGVDQGGYTESVPDMGPGKEEPDCHSCSDSGCPDCGRIDPADPEHQKYVAREAALARRFYAYPALEELLPDSTSEQRAEIQRLADTAIVEITVRWPKPGEFSDVQPF